MSYQNVRWLDYDAKGRTRRRSWVNGRMLVRLVVGLGLLDIGFALGILTAYLLR